MNKVVVFTETKKTEKRIIATKNEPWIVQIICDLCFAWLDLISTSGNS